MAPEQPEENPQITSSSEEEEESGSSVAESNSKDSKKVESSDDEEVDIPTQTSTVKKPDSASESSSESDSEPIQKTTPTESSTSKRKQPEKNLEVNKKKKTKTSDVEEEDEKKNMFQRLFSETDEIALLQGIIDFTSKRGDPYKEMDRFVDYVKKLIDFNANRSQLVTKIQRLKKKFGNIVKNSLKRGRSEDEITFSKDLDQQCFDLSRKIWGEDGVLVSKRKKVEETPKKKEFKLVAHSNGGETVKVDGSVELARFFKSENVCVYGLGESELVESWDMVEDGVRKREVEEKLTKLKVMQGELCVERTSLVAECARVIFKGNASSSGM